MRDTRTKMNSEATQDIAVEEELVKVQVYIDDAKVAVELADKLELLNSMPEFGELIIKGFMEGEPARIASIITDPEMQDEVNQRELVGAIKAVGYLGDYLRNILKRGAQMKAALSGAQDYQEELRNPNDGDI